MPLSKSSAAYLEQAVETGQLDEKLVNERVARILKLKRVGSRMGYSEA